MQPSEKALNLCLKLPKPDDTKQKTKLVRFGDGECYLPFRGRIIDLKTVAKLSNKANILDLGSAGGHGPRLFLESGQYMNLQRTACCVAWQIPQGPQRKKKQMESRDNHDPVATHRVKYADIESEMSWSDSVVYNAPVRVDIPEMKHVQQEHLHKALFPLDIEDLGKLQKNEAKTESVASR